MVTHVVADLFQAAERGKIGNGIGEHDLAALRQAGRNAGHVLLGNAHVDIAIWEPIAKRLQHRVAQVAGQQPDARVVSGEPAEGFDEGGSHGAASNSAIAAASCSSLGDL